MHGFANPAYLSGFLFSGLLCVAPYCVPGGVKVVSGVGGLCLAGSYVLRGDGRVLVVAVTGFQSDSRGYPRAGRDLRGPLLRQESRRCFRRERFREEKPLGHVAAHLLEQCLMITEFTITTFFLQIPTKKRADERTRTAYPCSSYE